MGAGRVVGSLYQRPGIALANFAEDPLGGGAATALRTIMAPNSLTPEEAKTIAERWGVDGFAGGVLNAVTDPVFLFAAVTSYRFPIPRAIRWTPDGKSWVAENYFKIAAKLERESLLKENAPSLLKNLWSARGNLRHTNAPALMDDAVAERIRILETYLGKFGDTVRRYEAASGRAFGPKEQILASAWLEGLHVSPLYTDTPLFTRMPKDKALGRLVSEWRTTYDEMWDHLFKSKENRKAILSALRAADPKEISVTRLVPATGRYTHVRPEHATAQEMETLLDEYFRKVPDYVPHFPAKNLEGYVERMQAELRETLALPREQVENAAAFRAIKQVMGSARRRRGGMLPHLDDLAEVEEYLDPKAYQQLKDKYTKSAQALAEGGHPYLPYSMRLMDSTATYVHQAGSMYGFAIKGNGRKLIQVMLKEKERGNLFSYKLLQETFLPSLMGLQTYKQAQVAHEWSSRLAAWHSWVGEQKFLPDSAKAKIQGWMIDKHGLPNILPIQRSMASWFYYGALGLNPAAAARNLFQLSLTTAPALGAKYTAEGVKRTMGRASKYFNMRLNGVGKNEAFAKAFPDYLEAGIPASPAIESTVQRTLEHAWDSTAREGFKFKTSKTKERVQDALMSMFSLSEQTVRMVTFEGAMTKGNADTLAALKTYKGKQPLPSKAQVTKAVRDFAREAVMETQFVNAVSNTPVWLLDKGPLTRQFMQFASRIGEWATNTALRIGGGVPSGRTVPGMEWLYGGLERRGFNPGTLARTVLWSEVIGRGTLEALGVDLDQSLLYGALPMPREYGPFAPIPLLPPAYGLVGGAALDLVKGDMNFSEFKRAAPLLVPGGVAMAKLVGYSPVGGREAAQLLGRQYVDWTKPTPDGRYPLYTAKGSLIGNMTAGQLFMSGTGLGEKGSAFQTEQELYRFLIANRDRIRDYKRQYVQRIMRNDVSGARKVDTEFQRAVPGVGKMEHWVSEDDITRAEDAMSVTRLEKLLDTMPAEVRPYYAEALQTALVAHGDPYMLGLGAQPLEAGPTAKSRRQPGPAKPIGQQPYQTQMSPLQSQRMQPQSISRGPYSLQQPFGGFKGFELGAEFQ